MSKSRELTGALMLLASLALVITVMARIGFLGFAALGAAVCLAVGGAVLYNGASGKN